MIIDIRTLKYKRKILGVRVKTDAGEYYDIDIDMYNELGLGYRGLDSLDLIEYGDLLVTQEELDRRYQVINISENNDALQKVKADLEEIKEAKRRVKKSDLKNKFYRFVDRRWIDEFTEFHLNNFEGNANIYADLNKDQFGVVKKYFRWCSKLLFDSKKKNKVLIAKPKKVEVLVDLMGGATDWYYDGTVDTGVMGGGVCELGHALRYEHYAYSPSINKNIIFGITCVSDFFQIDQDIIRQINVSQEMLMRELKTIIFVMKTNKMLVYAGLYYPHLKDIIDFYKGNKNYAGWLKFIRMFNRVGLPLTYSMIYQLDVMLRKSEFDVSVEKENKISNVDLARRKAKEWGYSSEVVDTVLKIGNDLRLTGYMQHYLINEEGNTAFLKESFSIILFLLSIKHKLKEFFDKDLLAARDIAKQYKFINDRGERRLASEDEIANGAMGIYFDFYLGDKKTEMLQILLKYISSVKFSMKYFYDTYKDDFLQDLTVLLPAIKWALEERFLDELSFLVVDSSKGSSGGINKSPDVKDGMLKNNKTEDVKTVDNGPSPLDASMKNKIQEIKIGLADGILDSNDFVFKVIKTIETFNRFSLKQKKYVDEAYKKVREKRGVKNE